MQEILGIRRNKQFKASAVPVRTIEIKTVAQNIAALMEILAFVDFGHNFEQDIP
ncbi:hypothetical protein Plhal710r2_c018g0079731 [Plasmopara halstedii]